jgi:mono/diheme cytochrome c family protein
MKYLFSLTLLSCVFFCTACSESSKHDDLKSVVYHSEKGIGRFQEFVVPTAIDQNLAAKGREIYLQKCNACHQLDNTQSIGPGWKGVTGKHSPAWIMNYLTNTDEMLDTDPELRAMIAGGALRMPDQSLSDDDARALLEWMRQNDALN